MGRKYNKKLQMKTGRSLTGYHSGQNQLKLRKKYNFLVIKNIIHDTEKQKEN